MTALADQAHLRLVMVNLAALRAVKLVFARAGRNRNTHHIGDHARRTGDYQFDMLALRQHDKTKAELEDEVRELDRRNADLKHELDEARDLIQRQDEQLQDVEHLFENWKEAFDMTLGDSGWELAAWVNQRDQEHADYVALVRNVGRPLEASEAQIKALRQLRRRGISLRGIA